MFMLKFNDEAASGINSYPLAIFLGNLLTPFNHLGNTFRVVYRYIKSLFSIKRHRILTGIFRTLDYDVTTVYDGLLR